jgi:hypothetical protein
MKDEKVTKSWGVAAALIAVVICVAAAAMSVWSLAQTRESPAKNAPVTIQWQSQSDIEARFTAKLIEHHKYLKKKLEDLAVMSAPPDVPAWQKLFNDHFLKTPRLWANGESTDGWQEVLPKLWGIVHGSKEIDIHFAWGMIEYVTYDKINRPKPEDDVDFRIKIKVTFSASPGDNILEGMLSHRRICVIQP